MVIDEIKVIMNVESSASVRTHRDTDTKQELPWRHAGFYKYAIIYRIRFHAFGRVRAVQAFAGPLVMSERLGNFQIDNKCAAACSQERNETAAVS